MGYYMRRRVNGLSPRVCGDPERLTWRQIRRFWEVGERRRAEDAEWLVATLVGGGG